MKDLKIISFFIPCKNGYIITLKFLYGNLITVQCFSFSWKVINVGYMGFKRFNLWFSWDLRLPVCQGCLQEVWYFNELYGHLWKNILSVEMSGRPRTTSFAEGNKQQPNPPLGGMKISSKCSKNWAWSVGRPMSDDSKWPPFRFIPATKFAYKYPFNSFFPFLQTIHDFFSIYPRQIHPRRVFAVSLPVMNFENAFFHLPFY